jgi:hypothetical protein
MFPGVAIQPDHCKISSAGAAFSQDSDLHGCTRGSPAADSGSSTKASLPPVDHVLKQITGPHFIELPGLFTARPPGRQVIPMTPLEITWTSTSQYRHGSIRHLFNVCAPRYHQALFDILVAIAA